MATATKAASQASTKPTRTGEHPGVLGAIFRFLASLKLAVISLLSLATLLGVSTWMESRYGTKVATGLVYQSPLFAVILGFLATNILCAALIRYPWKWRQLGFVITHIGLLVVLAGGLVTYLAADEGTVGLEEGEGKDHNATLIRDQTPFVRVRVPDGKEGGFTEYSYPFRPGLWAWKSSSWPWSYFWKPSTYDVLTKGSDAPFKLAVKDYLPSSRPRYVHEAAEAGKGVPMVRLKLGVTPPGALRPMDPFEGDVLDRMPWLVADTLFSHAAKDLGPAKFGFQYADRPEMVDDFLNPPGEGRRKSARLHYRDREGKARAYDWDLEGDGARPGTEANLPDSDLKVRLIDERTYPDNGRMARVTGWDAGPPVVRFGVRKGEGPERTYAGWACLPMAPGDAAAMTGEAVGEAPLIRVGYFAPPLAGRFGSVEVMGTPGGELYYRVFNRAGLGPKGPLKLKTPVQAFGGGANQPMSMVFEVEEYLKSGTERFTYERLDLPVGELSEAIPACLAELTVNGETREIWLRRQEDFKPTFAPVKFAGGEYGVCFDIDRLDLGFKIELEDFRVGMNPGTQEAKSFESKIRLTDEDRGIKDELVSISMNRPLTHRNYTFYQSRYVAMRDDDERPTGQFISIFQVMYDPGRVVKYAGCLLVVAGIFAQFTMRAGVFTDGGKAERARAAAKEARRLATSGETAAASSSPRLPDHESL